MDKHDNHADLIHNFYQEQQEIFDSSDQGIYAFLDDDSRICNEKFATMLGYKSSKEWSSVDTNGSFPDAFVAEGSQQTLVNAYQNAMESGTSATFQVTWKKKNKELVKTTVIIVPIMYQGHLLALHFVTI